MYINDTIQCFSNHMGLWMICPDWLNGTLSSIKNGTHKEAAKADKIVETNAYYLTKTGVAVIEMRGAMMKGTSKFGDTVSTVRTRTMLRDAMANEKVKSVVLMIESPGGHVAGTKELADDVATANQRKPVIAHIDDLGASAALWVASQAGEIYANETAEIGSIGVVAVLHDYSGLYEREGVKVHVVSTGALKGAGVAGTPISDELLADVQSKVDDLNEYFMSAISKGRRMSKEDVKKIATGATFMAKKAKDLGLIDAIQSIEATIQRAENIGNSGQSIAKHSSKYSILSAQSRMDAIRTTLTTI